MYLNYNWILAPLVGVCYTLINKRLIGIGILFMKCNDMCMTKHTCISEYIIRFLLLLN